MNVLVQGLYQNHEIVYVYVNGKQANRRLSCV